MQNLLRNVVVERVITLYNGTWKRVTSCDGGEIQLVRCSMRLKQSGSISDSSDMYIISIFIWFHQMTRMFTEKNGKIY